ncbi:bifunctional biotin--[acetyl-CoA-carboxylase] ligase/biotin operon repressor BirA [Aestuariirhabdus litorea]|uniref:bifunctional biotin--[acetyl-CoA-carboxylase] ligase/biotin operon repressor BirA n=1 Tax=Aestuariirhabdus litorea TaxID=2528527 RepID=UPI001A9FC481|nr:bifunctional biotin--[acetyl-CoA-carboxylase] ligase/biotin operon repressor BirA [Aestuariirhabdus litorea]
MDALLDILRDGEFHSGDVIGERLGVTRAAVWKQLKRLQEQGLELDSVKGRGYRLAPGTELLDSAQILSSLKPMPLPIDLDVYASTDSTNQRLLSRTELGRGNFCLAEHQTAGRGRRGRVWQSPFGANLYLSAAWDFREGAAALEGLSLAVGLAVVHAIGRQASTRLQLKWPNDLLWEGRKIAGVLLEISGDPAGECRVIIGIGINLRLTARQRSVVDQPCADLTEAVGTFVSKNRLASALIEELVQTLVRFERDGFPAFADEWAAYDAFRGKEVRVQTAANQWLVGTCRGVDHHGALQLSTAEGMISYRGGEVSLRGAENDT